MFLLHWATTGHDLSLIGVFTTRTRSQEIVNKRREAKALSPLGALVPGGLYKIYMARGHFLCPHVNNFSEPPPRGTGPSTIFSSSIRRSSFRVMLGLRFFDSLESLQYKSVVSPREFPSNEA